MSTPSMYLFPSGLHRQVFRKREEQWTQWWQQRKLGEKVKRLNSTEPKKHVLLPFSHWLIFPSVANLIVWVCLTRLAWYLHVFLSPLSPLCRLTPITSLLLLLAESRPTCSLHDQSLICMRKAARCALSTPLAVWMRWVKGIAFLTATLTSL